MTATIHIQIVSGWQISMCGKCGWTTLAKVGPRCFRCKAEFTQVRMESESGLVSEADKRGIENDPLSIYT